MRKLFSFICLALVNLLFSQTSLEWPLIPLPNHYEVKSGSFLLSPKTELFFEATKLSNHLTYFNASLQSQCGFQLTRSSDSIRPSVIILELVNSGPNSAEAYSLEISPNKIKIKGDTAGVFYGLQTLKQLINDQSGYQIKLPCLKIQDQPRFIGRGMHLDVCRHFFSPSFVKRYIDFLAMYKLNTFHWHLTEDQGWRIEIKKYPLLTQVGAFRKGSMVGKYSDSNYDTLSYGGYYTQEDIKEIVNYAQQRQITIVPEIEMPGHSQAAIAAYPWLSCSGKKQEVAKGWGVFEDVFCSKDSTFNFLKDVLDEVMTLFPGKYIHIGGDECPKTRWKDCAKCQALIKKEHLKDEHELQSYFIKRIETYVNSKGRQIIGWDEILEGGLAPNAAVMSWRGEEGGIAAAKQKHKVVMSPGTHCYFDHYQASPADEPLAIGGFTPLEKVYGYEPLPKSLTADEAKFIMGAQANVWTEYIITEKQLEYMSMPRMSALAEVLWTYPENKNETNYLIRLQKHFALLERQKVNFAKGIYQVNFKIRNDLDAKQLYLELQANPYLGEIHYTTDGSEPQSQSPLYTTPILLSTDMKIKSTLFYAGQAKTRSLTRSYQINKATNKSIQFKKEPSKYYNPGNFVMVNGESAKLPRINDQWLAWSGDDMELILDLQKSEDIQSVEIGFLKEELNWIYLPKEVILFVSNDGKKFTELQHLNSKQLTNERSALFQLKNTTAQYLKIIAKNKGKIASGFPGACEQAWLFSDEIKVK